MITTPHPLSKSLFNSLTIQQ